MNRGCFQEEQGTGEFTFLCYIPFFLTTLNDIVIIGFSIVFEKMFFHLIFENGEQHMKVILLMAITLDGRTGRNARHFVDWTDREDKRLFVGFTVRAGVVIMGSRTYDTIGYPLPGRKNVILTRNSERKSSYDNLVFTNRSPGRIISELETEGYTEAVLAGGPTINTLFAREELIDEIVVTISPKIFGFGTSLFTEDIAMELELKHLEKRGGHLLCATYGVIKTKAAY